MGICRFFIDSRPLTLKRIWHPAWTRGAANGPPPSPTSPLPFGSGSPEETPLCRLSRRIPPPRVRRRETLPFRPRRPAELTGSYCPASLPRSHPKQIGADADTAAEPFTGESPAGSRRRWSFHFTAPRGWEFTRNQPVPRNTMTLSNCAPRIPATRQSEGLQVQDATDDPSAGNHWHP
jgi:hypothetical protein